MDQPTIPVARGIPDIPAGELATHLNNLAYLRRVRHNCEGAQVLCAEALEISERVYGRGHPASLQLPPCPRLVLLLP